jgi:hypothetical protein
MSKLFSVLVFAALTLPSPLAKAQSWTGACSNFIKLDWMEKLQHFEKGDLCYILSKDKSGENVDFGAAFNYDSLSRSSEKNAAGNSITVLKRKQFKAVVLAKFEQFTEFGETLDDVDELGDSSMTMSSK